jgi:hypothetical protein
MNDRVYIRRSERKRSTLIVYNALTSIITLFPSVKVFVDHSLIWSGNELEI